MSEDVELEAYHLERAPIVEALIEIKLAEPLQQDSLGLLQGCAVSLEDEYPSQEDLMMHQVQFKAGMTPAAVNAPVHMGFLCKDAQSHRVVHLKLDGFGLSELKPYSSWNKFFPEAHRVWSAYREAIGGAPSGSWSIRYVNQISWPEGERMQDYLCVLPAIPDKPFRVLTGCFMRLQSALEQPSEGLFTQQIFQVISSEDGKVSFIVDHTFTYSSIGLTDTVLWDRIKQAQAVKNDYFRSTFTQKALEMFR